MTVRCIALALAAFTFLAPGSQADPTYTIPDPAALLAAADAASDATQSDAIATHHGNMYDASQFIAAAQLLRFSNESLSQVLNNSGDLGSRTIVRAADVGSVALQFAGDAAIAKLDEGLATVDALDAVGAAAVGAASAIAFTVLEEACLRPLTDADDPGIPECTDDSLGGQALGIVTGLLDDVPGGAGGVNLDDTLGAAAALLDGVLGGGS